MTGFKRSPASWHWTTVALFLCSCSSKDGHLSPHTFTVVTILILFAASYDFVRAHRGVSGDDRKRLGETKRSLWIVAAWVTIIGGVLPACFAGGEGWELVTKLTFGFSILLLALSVGATTFWLRKSKNRISLSLMTLTGFACVWLCAASPIEGTDTLAEHYCKSEESAGAGRVASTMRPAGTIPEKSCDMMVEEVRKGNGEIAATLTGVGAAFQYRFTLVGALLVALLGTVWKKRESLENGDLWQSPAVLLAFALAVMLSFVIDAKAQSDIIVVDQIAQWIAKAECAAKEAGMPLYEQHLRLPGGMHHDEVYRYVHWAQMNSVSILLFGAYVYLLQRRESKAKSVSEKDGPSQTERGGADARSSEAPNTGSTQASGDAAADPAATRLATRRAFQTRSKQDASGLVWFGFVGIQCAIAMFVWGSHYLPARYEIVRYAPFKDALPGWENAIFRWLPMLAVAAILAVVHVGGMWPGKDGGEGGDAA